MFNCIHNPHTQRTVHSQEDTFGRETTKHEHYLMTNTTFLNSNSQSRQTLNFDTLYWFQVPLIIGDKRRCS